MNSSSTSASHRTRSLVLRKLFLGFAVLMSSLISAQVTVTINTVANASQNVPMGSSNYHVGEHIYLATEIGQNFTINHINFDMSTLGGSPALNTYNNVALYLKYTAAATLAAGPYTTVGYTPVYSGTMAWAATGFAGVDLTTPFPYVQANGNLELLVVRTDNLAHAGPVFACAQGSGGVATNVTSRRYNSTVAPVNGTTSLTASTFRAAIQLINIPMCTGTPAPGNTTATVSGACVGQTFTVGLQNNSGLGSTYAWQADNGGGFLPFGTNAPTQTVSQSVSTAYRCTVTCAAGGGSPTFATSTAITVPMASAYPVDFASVVFPPNCWTRTGTGTAFLLRDNVSGYGAGSGSAKWDFWNGNAGTTQILTSPTFTAIGANQQVRFDVAGAKFTDAAIDQITLEYSSTGSGGPWTAIVVMNNALGGDLNTAGEQGALFVPTAAQWATRTYPIPLGASAIRFNGLAAFGNNVFIDNITIENIPNCPPPSSVTAIGASTSSATVSWAEAGTFIVEYGPAATFTIPGTGTAQGPQGTSTVVTGVAASSYLVLGLVHPTQYRVFVRKDCTGTADGYSVNSPGVVFYSQPPNDSCTNAPNQSVSPGNTINMSGNSIGATNTGEPFPFANAWETFTVTSCVTSLSVNWCSTGPGYTAQLNVLVQDCPGISSYIFPVTNANSCPNGNRQITYGNIPAGTYYLAIYGFGPYTATVTAGPACPPPPPNDICTNAQPILCGETLAGTCVSATTTGAPSGVCGGMLMNDAGGVWYKASDLCGSVTASLCSSTPQWDTKMFVFTGTCGALNCFASDDDFCNSFSSSAVTWIATAGTDYYIYVLPFDGATTPLAFNLSLTCANTPVIASGTAVDNCGSSFFNVFVNITNLGGGPNTINWVATPGGPGSMAGVLGSNAIPVNFGTNVQVDVTVANGASGCTADLGSFFSNCPINLVCGTPVNISHCYRNNDPRTFTFHTPTPGETVTVTFSDGQMDPGDVIRAYSGTNSGGAPIPSLTGSFADLFNVTGTSSGQDMYIEIDSPSDNTCEDGAQETWVFLAQCTPGCVQPDGSVAELITCGTYSFSLGVTVTFTGDAATTDLEYTVGGVPQTPITGLTDLSPTQNLGPFPIGTSVVVVLAHESDGACDRNLGTFNGTSTFCPPPGWTCALPLDVSSYPYTHSNTTQGTGNDVGGPQCGLGANYGGGEDFIYRLNIATAGDYQINMTMPTSSFGGWFLKSSSNCTTTGSCIANAVNTIVGGTASGIVNLAAGSYYLIIDSRPLPNFFTYTLNIQQFIPLPGELCSVAINIPSVPTTVTGSTSGYLNNYNGNGCGGFGTDGGLDLVYSYTPPVNQILALSMCLGVTNYDTKLYVYANTCTGAPVACNDDNCSAPLFAPAFVSSIAGLNVSAGTTYFFVVDGFSATDFGNYTLDISVLTPPANDDCAMAQALTVNTPANCPANAVAGDNSAADDEGTAFSCFGGGPYNDVWYSFNSGPNTSVSFSFPTFNFATILVEVLQGSCVGTSVYCQIGGAALSGNIPTTPNTTYLIRVGSEAGQGGSFTICLNATPPPPANDDCANAVPLTVNPLGSCPANAVTGTTLNSLQSAAEPSCDPGLHGDVWYTFNSGTNNIINWTFAQGTTNISIVDLFQGTCTGLVEVDCDFSFANISSQWNVSPNTTYFVRVSYNTTFDTPGTFSICISNNICTSNAVTIDFTTDPFGNETGYEILPIGGGPAVCSGAGLLSNAEIAVQCCLANGCYRLRVTDSFGDGMQTGAFIGGYVLRDPTGRRIIDNTSNFSDWNNPGTQSSTQSALNTSLGGGGFCVPLTADRLIFNSCDKLDWRPGEYIVANDNAAVTAVWNSFASGSTQRANSGYEMWFFNPNGGYSYRRFHSHAVSDGFGPASATRAAHIKLNGWSGNALQNNVLYNVRVRGRVYNVPVSESQWGSACRMKLDPLRAQCRLTKLIDQPGHQYFSCGATRQWGNGQYVHANPVSKTNTNGGVVNANRYQFRFRILAEGYSVTRTVTSYFVQLNWGNAAPLQNGKTYEVDVRASFDNGVTWCSDFIAPALVDPWGDVCLLNMVAAVQGGGQNIFLEDETEAPQQLTMYPNPNRGDQLYLSIPEVAEGVNTVSVDIYDLFGKRLSARTVAVQDGFVNTVLELNGDLAAGMYVVNITAGGQVYTERLVIQN